MMDLRYEFFYRYGTKKLRERANSHYQEILKITPPNLVPINDLVEWVDDAAWIMPERGMEG
jgi:hypothetical protein